MTDYYVYSQRESSVHVEHVMRTNHNHIAREAIALLFNQKERLTGAFGIDTQTGIQNFTLMNRKKVECG